MKNSTNFQIVKYALIFLAICGFGFSTNAQQNCLTLLQKAPLPAESVGKAFTSVKLEFQSEFLDDGTEFKRVKSWAFTFDQKQYSEQLAKYVERWDRRAEENSFALNYIPDTTQEVSKAIYIYQRTADSILSIWNPVSHQARNLDPDFTVLSDMDYGCDEIKASAKKLNQMADQQTEFLNGARMKMTPLFDRFQRYFNKLSQIEDPIMNNEVINQMSKVLGVLEDWDLIVNATMFNMVETGVSLNNGLCRP
ncbi:MAG: hypothetical protein IPH93_12830 [Saprospiraceae bacterium]|nr:hypothetical protein [Saprospiraceae bacterium]MBK7810658.1 hypothetical protein [Saprospiraceae bacterium]MBK9631448.1 hypothetical protein [Saprospiraceae bacterium]